MKHPKPGIPYYPWDHWFKLKTFKIKRNVDFTCQPHSMAVQIRMAAATRKRWVSVYINGNVIEVTVRKKPIRQRKPK